MGLFIAINSEEWFKHTWAIRREVDGAVEFCAEAVDGQGVDVVAEDVATEGELLSQIFGHRHIVCQVIKSSVGFSVGYRYTEEGMDIIVYH